MGYNRVIQKLHSNMQRKSKMHEQLEIGKVRFEVLPVYMNKVCIHSLFKIKYTQSTSQTMDTASNSKVKLSLILVLLVLMCLLYIVCTEWLHSLGLLTLVNEDILTVLTPCIFPNTLGGLTPHLTTLLAKSGFMSM